MVSLFAEINCVGFWPKTMDYSDQFLSAPVSPDWKVQVLFPMVSLFAETNCVSFWPNTMDYSEAFFFLHL